VKESALEKKDGSDVVIVEFTVPPANAVLLQSILQGEDGLATIRCFDPEKRLQQFWTTRDQLDELQAWIASMPESMDIQLTGEWFWRSGDTI